ncbi:Ig-like domain-containing protein [Massilia sp. Root351]|jgi:RHS repeat-associated protein|uniref:Ig-like domain-containing protein n=1 Tax=Massilia sp. Root351 TaxID=1736522 RepID=UPI0009E8673F|nr:Ig-like domain-containing protein [Massilia sp. Root351]
MDDLHVFRWTNVPIGTYTVTAVATDNRGATVTSAPWTVRVAANVPPNISIASPVNNVPVVVSGNAGTVVLKADTSDEVGHVNQVQYYSNGVLLYKSFTRGSWLVNWNNAPVGTYTITAKAIDHNGASTMSAPVTLIVTSNAPPTVSMTATPTVATAPGTIALSAVASDSDGSVSKVEFFNGTALLATVIQAPFAYTWSNVAAGSYSLTARATDNVGSATTTQPSVVTIATGAPQLYYVYADQVNTAREVTNSAGVPVWRADTDEPFGANMPNENPSGLGTFSYNLRFPGQYYDQESNLYYNYFRDYDPQIGRYIESDPIGLRGGINTYSYVEGNPLRRSDRFGLFGPAEHRWITAEAMNSAEKCKDGPSLPNDLPSLVSGVDRWPHSQEPENSYWHAMSDGTSDQTPQQAEDLYSNYVNENIASGTPEGLARALHAVQDSAASGHRGFQPWAGGIPSPRHLRGDVLPSLSSLDLAIKKSKDVIDRYNERCGCKKR